MAFPRLNMLSFWITAASFALLLASFLAVGGGPLSGWTAYPPLSAIGAIAGPGEGLGQTLWFFSIGLFCISSLLTAINIIATVIDERGARHDAHAHAADLLELVRHRHPQPAVVLRASRRRCC